MESRNYKPADMWRRGLAFLVNMWLLMVLFYPLKAVGADDRLSMGTIQLVSILVCANRYWSPGKWIFRIKVLKSDNTLFTLKERILRNLPNLLIIGMTSIPFSAQKRIPGEEFTLDPVKSVYALVWTGITIFWFSNMFTAFFEKKDRTLMDIKLDTYVGMPPQPMKFKPVKL